VGNSDNNKELWDELKALAYDPNRLRKRTEGLGRAKPKPMTPEKKRRSVHEICRGKHVFESPGDAKRLMKTKRRSGGVSAGFRSRIYRCASCNGWHIANRDKDK